MRTHDGRVDHGVFIVGIFGQGFKNTLPNTLTAPPHVARVDHTVIPKTLRHVPPRDASPIAKQYCLNKKPIISRCRTTVALFAGQKVFDAIPLIITKRIPSRLGQLLYES